MQVPGALDDNFPELLKNISQATMESEPLHCVYAEERESRALECYQLERTGGLQEIAENMLEPYYPSLSPIVCVRIKTRTFKLADLNPVNECINMSYNFEQLQLQDCLSDFNASSANPSVHTRLVRSMTLEANGFRILLSGCGKEEIHNKEKGGRPGINVSEKLMHKFAKNEFLGWTALMENF